MLDSKRLLPTKRKFQQTSQWIVSSVENPPMKTVDPQFSGLSIQLYWALIRKR